MKNRSATFNRICKASRSRQAKMKLPDLKKQPTPHAVLDEHLAALNACDRDPLLA